MTKVLVNITACVALCWTPKGNEHMEIQSQIATCRAMCSRYPRLLSPRGWWWCRSVVDCKVALPIHPVLRHGVNTLLSHYGPRWHIIEVNSAPHTSPTSFSRRSASTRIRFAELHSSWYTWLLCTLSLPSSLLDHSSEMRKKWAQYGIGSWNYTVSRKKTSLPIVTLISIYTGPIFKCFHCCKVCSFFNKAIIALPLPQKT